MAIQKDTYFIGRTGPLIGYLWKDIPCWRTVPENVRQTKATKRSAGKFGISRKIAKGIRHSLVSILPNPKDRQMMHRLDDAMYQWLLHSQAKGGGDHQPVHELTGHSFNEKTVFAGRLKTRLAVNWLQRGEITVILPSFYPVQMITAPAHTISVTLQLAAVCCRLDNFTATSRLSEPVIIDWNDKLVHAQQLTFPLSIPRGSVAIVAVSIRYTVTRGRGKRQVTAMEWMPAGVIDAVYRPK